MRKSVPRQKNLCASSYFNAVKRVLILMCCLCITSILFAQQKTISGAVTGADSKPISGVSVYVEGTSKATVTDGSGVFTIAISNGDKVLVFSYVGFNAERITIGSQTTINVTLKTEQGQLDSVVVVGYGTQRRNTVSGAVAEVKLDKLTSRSLSNVGEALQGKAPGVVVTNEGGDPTSGPRINIRGQGGINGEGPLYVVDGVIGGAVSNPNEIESISVLKDASAAIYGARASGGVILITTKKGRAGNLTINADAKYGVQTPWKKLHALNAKEYADAMNTAADNAGQPRLDAYNADIYPDGQITKTNWIDEVFRSAPISDYNVGIAGGNEKSKFFMSFGYRNQDGVLLNTYTQRYNFRINTEHNIKPWLKVGENMQFVSSNGNGANTSSAYTGALLTAIFYPPSVPVYDANGAFSGLPVQYAGAYGDVINPVAYLKRLDSKSPYNNLFVNPYVEVRPLKGLLLRSSLGITKSFSNNTTFTTRVPEIGKIFDFNQLSLANNNYTDIVAEQTANYTKKIGDHNINVLAGYTYQHSQSDGFSVYAQDFNDEKEELRYLNNANEYYPGSSYKGETAIISYLARINYDYKEKYLLTILGRRDGTSLLRTDNQFQNYGSASAGWVVSKERFLQEVSWLSNLKLRASYGILGNLGSLPSTAVNVPLTRNSPYIGQTPIFNYGYYESALSNPNIKWASSEQQNYGLDLSVFKGRLSLVADYFIKTTKDMLLQRPPAVTSGVTGGQWVNAGKAQDKGIELGLNYNSETNKAFQYSVGATLTKIDNKLLSLAPDISSINTSGINIRSTLNPVVIRTGIPLYSYNVIQTDGIFKSQAEVDAYTNKNGGLIQPNAKPGDLKFIDANGSGGISDSDRVVVGSAYPDFTYGFSFNASYKNFDINIFVQGVVNNKIFNGLKYLTLQAAPSGQKYNMLSDAKNAWSPENPNSDIPRLSLSDPNGNFGTTSDWYIENGGYMRLKNITIGYTLPANTMKRLGLNTARLYVTANNLLTITNYSGFDPEVGMNYYGIDLGQYPQARSVFVGLTVNL